jgi:hypothetical protein
MFLGLPLNLPDIEILDAGSSAPVLSGAGLFDIRSGDAVSQDALDGAAVELFEDLRALTCLYYVR